MISHTSPNSRIWASPKTPGGITLTPFFPYLLSFWADPGLIEAPFNFNMTPKSKLKFGPIAASHAEEGQVRGMMKIRKGKFFKMKGSRQVKAVSEYSKSVWSNELIRLSCLPPHLPTLLSSPPTREIDRCPLFMWQHFPPWISRFGPSPSLGPTLSLINLLQLL